MMSLFPQIVIGTYEEFVLGYSPQYENENKNKCKLHQIFASHSHQASIRCVTAHNHLMASAGADENINIYDMVAMEVSSVINYHNATVTCLEFTKDGSHLVTANQNGDIAIFRCRDWTLVKLWKGAHKHANGVTSISIHPSGSLLLTTGADNIVRFWNLIKGRQAYATNFSKKCSIGNSLNFGIWSKNGKFYAVCIGNKIEVYKTQTAAIVYEIQANSRIACSEFIKKTLICLGTEDGSVEIHSIVQKKLLLKSQAHKSRVKSLASFTIKVLKNNESLLKSYLVTVDSKGSIKLWYFKKKGLNFSIFLRGETDCGCRITCLAAVMLSNIKKENISCESVNGNEVTPIATVETADEVCFDETQTKSKSLKHKISKNDNSHPVSLNQKRFKNGVTISNLKCLKRKKQMSMAGKKKLNGKGASVSH